MTSCKLNASPGVGEADFSRGGPPHGLVAPDIPGPNRELQVLTPSTSFFPLIHTPSPKFAPPTLHPSPLIDGFMALDLPGQNRELQVLCNPLTFNPQS